MNCRKKRGEIQERRCWKQIAGQNYRMKRGEVVGDGGKLQEARRTAGNDLETCTRQAT